MVESRPLFLPLFLLPPLLFQLLPLPSVVHFLPLLLQVPILFILPLDLYLVLLLFLHYPLLFPFLFLLLLFCLPFSTETCPCGFVRWKHASCLRMIPRHVFVRSFLSCLPLFLPRLGMSFLLP